MSRGYHGLLYMSKDAVDCPAWSSKSSDVKGYFPVPPGNAAKDRKCHDDLDSPLVCKRLFAGKSQRITGASSQGSTSEESLARFADGKTEGGGTQSVSSGHTVRGRNRFESLASQTEQFSPGQGLLGTN